MTDDPQSADRTSAEGPLAGERLAAARRDQDITLADIARELHLDEGKVQALEQNQFEVLGAPVFAKGHLRKYAELVGIPSGEVLGDYYALNRSAGAPPVVGAPRKQSREVDLGRWVVPIAILLVLVLTIGWWLRSGSPMPSFGSAEQATGDELRTEALPQTAAPAASVSPAVVPVGAPTGTDDASGSDDPSTAAPEPEESGPARSPVASAPPGPAAGSDDLVDDGLVAVTLSFSGDCWTEVTDAAGNRLFFNLGQDGNRVDVQGEPPLRVLLGNYTNAAVAVNDNPFSIPSSAIRGQTARFSIFAP